MKKQSGIASIEFGLGSFAFFLVLIIWIEMTYMAYVSSINDFAIAEAARIAKKVKPSTTGHHQSQSIFIHAFKQAVARQAVILGSVIDPDNYHITVYYYATLEALSRHTGVVSDQCRKSENENIVQCGESNNSSLAIYHVSYTYSPISRLFMLGSTFDREVIVIQEYERDQFKF